MTTPPTLCDRGTVPSWIYLLHPPRERFVATITEEEAALMQTHAGYLAQLLEDGVLVLAGPTFGDVNTGISIFEADDEDAARAIMMADPAVAGGLMTPELRPMRVSFLRGRD
ncbi:YciI family protein [Nocardioides kongjuensis]|uniref:Uncharacterized protein YciI n=1 Tax=Nocardioides kongjuensis TaxID=349522 RepID=A0A852RRL3_9ACTN|nr:uncharacterized protein YciI [Nocardioides kongjuensis]